MELYPLPADQAVRVAALTSDVDAGWARRIHHGPMTVAEVLERGRAEMEAEDEAERRAADPFRYVGAHRAPRRRLRDLLRRRS